MTSLTTETTRSDVASRLTPGPAMAAAALLAIVIWLFWGWFASQVRAAIQHQADWGHVLVVPFIAGYFVYLCRDKILAKPFRTAWSGLFVAVSGMAIYFICLLGPTTLRHNNFLGFGVWLTLVGLVLLFFGWRSMIWLWFPLAYWLVFGQYISERFLNIVTFRMQDITARGAYFFLALGMDVELNGNTITVFDKGVARPLNIAEACSGMRMLMAFLALGVAMAYTGFRRYWQMAALVAMAVPTAIFVNILRVVTLAILSLVNPNFSAGEFHSFVGLVWLVPAFLIYLGLMWVIGHMVIEEPSATASVVRATAASTPVRAPTQAGAPS